MWTSHVSGKLAAYVDGELTPRDAQQVELHLAQCGPCRTECDRVKLGMAMIERLPSVEAPDAVWAAIDAKLQDSRPTSMLAVRSWRMVFAAAAMVALTAAVMWRWTGPSSARWEVRRLEGKPVVAGTAISGAGRIGSGESIETDASARAMVTIGRIGSVEIAPNTRVRIVTARPAEHRLALDQGAIHATISAPPRLFFVDTPSGTAVDLGCEYTLNTDEDGSGLLRVSKGWVAFQWNGLESLVPAGASCPTRPRIGPAIPYFDDATGAMKQALAVFGLEKVGGSALTVILAESRVRDTLTLWHLVSRVGVAERARVCDRIAELTPLPAGVSRQKALELDPATLTRWREELAWTW
jgi:anti-sigma factor RsiW